MRIISRTSKWAIWARRLASFALPLSVLPVWMHREKMLESETFQIILLLALLLAFFAVLVGLAAYIRLWQTGDHGWGRATFGIFLGLICLSPGFYGILLGMRYPFVNDVSTDLVRPVELIVKMLPSVEGAPNIVEAFPDAVSRSYQLTPVQVFTLVEKLVQNRQWDLRVRRAPDIGRQDGQINALAMTMMGWRDEVAIRISYIGNETIVDMRSASLEGAHDLGANGTRIENFLRDLDELVVRTLNENAAASEN